MIKCSICFVYHVPILIYVCVWRESTTVARLVVALLPLPSALQPNRNMKVCSVKASQKA
jgi:hypothetical protein